MLHHLLLAAGPDFEINFDDGPANIDFLIEEVYEKAARNRVWNVVRHAAALKRKVVNSLTINLTDLLIRQKYVSIGFGKTGK